jgi:ABC-type multidrug transport system fused ATPase/permease subunit
MERIVHPKTYVKDLERQLRAALGILILIAVVQLIILMISPELIGEFIRDTDYLPLLAINVIILGIIAAGGYMVQHAVIPGGIHIAIDQKLFGSLDRSNQIIFDSLLKALAPSEEAEARTIPPKLKVRMTENIFSELANDPYLFTGMVRSNLFRFWNWYWILIYACMIFIVTSVASFVALLMSDSSFVLAMFFFNTILAAGSVAGTIYLGSLLQRRSRETVNSLVGDRREKIADMIRDHIDYGNTAAQAEA